MRRAGEADGFTHLTYKLARHETELQVITPSFPRRGSKILRTPTVFPCLSGESLRNGHLEGDPAIGMASTSRSGG